MPRMARRALGYFLLAALFQVTTALVSPEHDSAAWLYLAARQAHGEMPGRELWDNKLPPIYLVGRAALATGAPLISLWLLESAVTALGALAVALIVRRALPGSDSAATWAGALVCLASGIPQWRGAGYAAEVYALPLSAAAVWLLLSAQSGARPALGRWCGAGLFWTLAAAFRLPLLPAALLTSGWAVYSTPRARLRSATAVGAGALLGVVLVFAHPLRANYAAACFEAALAWPLRAGGSGAAGPLAPTTLARLADFLQNLAKLGWLHGAAALGLWLSRHQVARPARGLLLLWYLGAACSALAGWNQFAHYHYVLLAPAAVGCGLLFVQGAPRGRAAARVIVCAVALTLALGASVKLTLRARREAQSVELAAVRAFFADRPADESVLFWVRGRHLRLAWEVNHPAGVRHFLARSYLDMDLRLFEEFVDELTGPHPLWIVEERASGHALLSEPGQAAWESRVESLGRAQQRVRLGFRRAAVCGPFEIWRRVEAAAPTEERNRR